MIVRYTNVLGEINHGLIIDTHPSGMICVYWDVFTALLARLEQRGNVSDFVRNGLSVRKTWVRAPRVGAHGDKSELLPITTSVAWSSDELKSAHTKMKNPQPVL